METNTEGAANTSFESIFQDCMSGSINVHRAPDDGASSVRRRTVPAAVLRVQPDWMCLPRTESRRLFPRASRHLHRSTNL